MVPTSVAHYTRRRTRARCALQSISVCWQAALGHLPIRSHWIGPLVIVWLIASASWNIATTSAYVRPFWMVGSHPNPQQAPIDALLASVPPTASVAATDTLNPHLSDRYTLFLLPDPQSYTADYVAIDVPDAASINRQADQVIYEAMLTSGSYRVIGTAGQVVLLQRLSLSPPALHALSPATERTREDGPMVIPHRIARRHGLLEQVHPEPVQAGHALLVQGGATRQRSVMEDGYDEVC